MAATDIVVELPTNRVSRFFDNPPPDVHDPNYIPVLNGAEIKVDFCQISFSALPSIPVPHKSASDTSLKRTKSGTAPERVMQSDGVQQPASLWPPASNATNSQAMGSSLEPAGQQDMPTSGWDDSMASSSNVSTPIATAVLREQMFMVPGNSAPRAEDIRLPTVPHSARSSMSSIKKTHVPTSRFNKKSPGTPAMPLQALQQRMRNPSPATTRDASPEVNLVQQQQHQQHEQQQRNHRDPLHPPPPQSPEPTPVLSPTLDMPPLALPNLSTPRLQATKSTASERRARALHSHPSNVSMKSRKNSNEEETVQLPLTQQPARMQEPSPSASRSTSQSNGNSQQTSPTLNSALPDIPAGAPKSPSTREATVEKCVPIRSPNPASTTHSPRLPLAQKDHLELAEFMSAKKAVVFRRFDEVHVRLLLKLQDEIASLEKEVLEVEEAGPGRPDNIGTKANVMQELRKLLAEYDHLFVNWSSMQANKASNATKEQLAEWLQNPAAGLVAISEGARADLVWLQNSKDLSSVSFDPEQKLLRSDTSGSSTRGTRSGGLLALFGCASKRR